MKPGPKTKPTQKPRATINKVPVWCAHDKIVSCVELKPNPKNPNTHPASQIELLGKIIKEQGWRAPITVSNRSGYIVKGHGRLEAAFRVGIEKAPVDYQDYESEAAEHADMVADNRLAELASLDDNKLSALMAELSDFDIDAELTGFTDFERFLSKPEPKDISDSVDAFFEVVVSCDSERKQEELYTRLTGEGLSCRVLTL